MDPIVTASLISAGSGFGASALGSTASGFFGINQAKKNRAFQERMYNKQVEDNIKFWNMTNEYNLPSAQLQRIRDAGLSPLLMYGEGGLSGNLAQGSPQSAQAPHGDKAQAHIAAEFNLANVELLKAQIDNLRSDSEQKRAQAQLATENANNSAYDLMYKRLTQQVNVALKHGELSQIFAATDNLRQQTYATGQMTLQSILSMMQAREYEIKRFNLDASTIGEQLKQRWEEIATGRISANAQMKSAFAAMLNAQSNWNLSNAQIGQIALNMSQSREMFPLLMENQRNLNWNQVQDRIFKGVQISNAQKEGFMLELKNRLEYSGASQGSIFMKFAGPWILPAVRGNAKDNNGQISY